MRCGPLYILKGTENMRKIIIADATLRMCEQSSNALSFKEKIEIAKKLDKLNADVIETAPITHGKTDILFLHTICPLIKNSIISCPAGLDEESVCEAYDAIKTALRPRLHLLVPVSTVQMEYICHKKPKFVLEMIEILTKKATSLCSDVEVSLLDATRAEKSFLYQVAKKAIECGAKTLTLCDNAGEMLPDEFEIFVKEFKDNVPEYSNICLSAECSDSLSTAVSCAVSCVKAGISQLKVTASQSLLPSMSYVSKMLVRKSTELDISCGINMTVIDNATDFISSLAQDKTIKTAGKTLNVVSDEFTLNNDDDITAVSSAVAQMGYDLTDEDLKNVYDEFKKISQSKAINTKELDAIVASVALQVPVTYKLKSYVVNNGNIITPTAHIQLEKNGEICEGICLGDGPLDAAFSAIDQIAGRAFELDDFQLQSVTQSSEAMAQAVVKLRSKGKLYSAKGISRDVIGAGINAYISAVNKICFEEEM